MQSFFRRAPHSPERANHGAASHILAGFTDTIAPRFVPATAPARARSEAGRHRGRAEATPRQSRGRRGRPRGSLWAGDGGRAGMWRGWGRGADVDAGPDGGRGEGGVGDDALRVRRRGQRAMAPCQEGRGRQSGGGGDGGDRGGRGWSVGVAHGGSGCACFVVWSSGVAVRGRCVGAGGVVGRRWCRCGVVVVYLGASRVLHDLMTIICL